MTHTEAIADLERILTICLRMPDSHSRALQGEARAALEVLRNSSAIADLPENRPLYKDSGLWQQRSDDMEKVLSQQGCDETDIEFLERCSLPSDGTLITRNSL